MKLFFALIISCLLSTPSIAAVWSITYPRAVFEEDKRNDYPLAVLKLALDATGVRYELLPSQDTLMQGKAIRQLKKNRDINVFWGVTDKQREQDLLPIRIPIDKGLIGWRVAFIRQARQAEFANINSLKELLNFSVVQGKDWPDTKILQANGFNVTTAKDYLGSLDALLNDKGDFFPRSVMEILNEWQDLPEQNDVLLEQNYIIHYPAAIYFFVNKADVTLANLIATGLKKAIASGEFDALFLRYFDQPIKQLNLAQRKIFRLSNASMTSLTQNTDSSLWFDL